MKNKDIEKAVKCKGLDIMNGRVLYLIFSSFRPIKKNIPNDAA